MACYDPTSVCQPPPKNNNCGGKGKCPPLPCSDTSNCLPNWICVPSSSQARTYPTPPGARILPMSVGGRNNSKVLITTPSEIACVSRSNIQAFGDIPIHLLPMNYVIPPIPRWHDQPDCHYRIIRQSQRSRTQKRRNLVKQKQRVSNATQTQDVVSDRSHEKDKTVQVQTDQKSKHEILLSNPTGPRVDSYVQAVDSLCSAVEGFLSKVDPDLDPQGENKDVPTKNVEFFSNPKETISIPVQKVEKKIIIKKLVQFESGNGNGNVSSNVKVAFTIQKSTRARVPQSKPKAKPIIRSLSEKPKSNKSCHNSSLVSGNKRPESQPKPKRASSAHQSKRLIEIPSPQNPFLSMTQIQVSSKSKTKTQVKSLNSTSQASGLVLKSNAITNPSSTSMATQTLGLFRSEEFISSASAGCGGSGSAPNVANKGCPMVRPRCPDSGKKEEGGGFFSKIASLFGMGGSKK